MLKTTTSTAKSHFALSAAVCPRAAMRIRYTQKFINSGGV